MSGPSFAQNPLLLDSCIPGPAGSFEVLPTTDLGEAKMLYNNIGGMGPETSVPTGLAEHPRVMRLAPAVHARVIATANGRDDAYHVRTQPVAPPSPDTLSPSSARNLTCNA